MGVQHPSASEEPCSSVLTTFNVATMQGDVASRCSRPLSHIGGCWFWMPGQYRGWEKLMFGSHCFTLL